MPWTAITRTEHSRKFTRYPSDLTDAEWRVMSPLVNGAVKTSHLGAYKTSH